MKTKRIILSLIAGSMLGASLTSCRDMLSPDSERHSYEVAQDTLYSYWGILKSMQNVAERYVILGECRGELVSPTSYITDSIKSILDFDMSTAIDGSCRYLKATDYYHIINSCNAYLASADLNRTTGTLTPYMSKEFAQVEAIRAWTYLQLVQVYGEVPFYTQPLLTTDEINSFMDDPNKQMANADNLVDLLRSRLEAARAIELQYGFPQYENYGYTSTVCHSTKCMIPINLILGDLYLLKGDQVSCREAAQCYYNFLGNTQNTGHIEPGGVPSTGYTYIAYKGEGEDKGQSYVFSSGTPWTETGETSSSKEAITCIPSSTNKLWGTVLRGVNNVFGYDAEISVRTNAEDTATTASVDITPQYDLKQLEASNAYYTLCSDQNFEEYIGASSQDLAEMTLSVDPAVGDARQYWVRDVRQTYSNGVSNTEKFITKQNPNGNFTTVYPMIYRKSMVWLRYAEALNGAGYPSFAFAILKNGLCNNDEWLPDTTRAAGYIEYAIKDSAYYYNGVSELTGDSIQFPTISGSQVSPYRTKAELVQALIDAGHITALTSDNEKSINYDALTLQNWPETDENSVSWCDKVCNYIDKREMDNKPSFLNFSFTTFNGFSSNITCPFRTSLTQRGYSSKSDKLTNDDNITIGIHSHGCGILKIKENNSTYNYVDMINKKAAAYGKTFTKEQIYSGYDDATVRKCVEDLIVDEEALELAFEGTRFFDLMRVAHRRNDPSYLANRLAQRDPSLASKLLNTKNWYFPLPTY